MSVHTGHDTAGLSVCTVSSECLEWKREMAGHSGESTQYSPSTLSHLWTRLNIGGKYSTILDQYTVLYSTELYSWRKLSLKRREELFI